MSLQRNFKEENIFWQKKQILPKLSIAIHFQLIFSVKILFSMKYWTLVNNYETIWGILTVSDYIYDYQLHLTAVAEDLIIKSMWRHLAARMWTRMLNKWQMSLKRLCMTSYSFLSVIL